MAKSPPSGKNDAEILDYRHDRARRKNNPPAGLAAQGRIAERPTERYAYNPHRQSEARRRPALGFRREQLGPARPVGVPHLPRFAASNRRAGKDLTLRTAT